MIKFREIFFITTLFYFTVSPQIYIDKINNFKYDKFATKYISSFNLNETNINSLTPDNVQGASTPIWDKNWEYVNNSIHFEIHYNITGVNGTTHDYALATIAALEYSWYKEVQDLGFLSPPDPSIDVYIYDLEVSNELGVTTHIRVDDQPHIKYVGIDNDMPVDQLNYVCAHEFFHCVQASYDLIERYIWENETSTLWVKEGTATWMGSKVFPEWKGGGSYVEHANNYLENTNRLLTFLSYDAVLLWIFIDENYGGHNTINYFMQQNVIYNPIQALNTTLYLYQNTTFENVYKKWTLANYLNDLYYTNGEYFDTPFSWSIEYNGIENEINSIVIDWGAEYWYIDINEAYTSTISIPIYISSDGFDNVTILMFENDYPIFFDIELNSSYEGSLNLMQANNLDKIILILRSTGNQTSIHNTEYSIILQDSSYILNGPSQNTSPSFLLICLNNHTISESSITELYISNRTGQSHSTEVKMMITDEKGIYNSSTTTIQVKGAIGITLYIGWNLIGVPYYLTGPSVESVFDENLTCVDAVYGYADGVWTYWFPVSSTLDELECGRGYWVLANDDFTVTLTGTLGDAPPLVEGWNLVRVRSYRRLPSGNQLERRIRLRRPDGDLELLHQRRGRTTGHPEAW